MGFMPPDVTSKRVNIDRPPDHEGRAAV